ncbi:MAG: AzlC family ABC transporter permease [Bacilli bacterium]|nr:AzlC family ABC transporter permease [Bacilli bacterium]
MKKSEFIEGLKSGIPIGLGYLSVSFTFGIMAVSLGFNWWQALLVSMTTLTSAGQLAGIGVMVMPGAYIEMLVSQLTINVRYAFMSISLSQKLDSKFKGVFKWLLGFFITDEIFAVAISKEEIKRSFFFGLGVCPYIGWALGTFLGAILGNVFPEIIMNALCIAIYAMFVAIIVPVCKKDWKTTIVVLLSGLLSACFYYIPVFKTISSGLQVSVCAVVAAILGAIIFPRKEGNEHAN